MDLQSKIKMFLNKINPYFLIFLIVVFGFKFGFFQNLGNLDLSWVWAINFISSRGIYKWGQDVFFTYGPLGYILVPMTIGINVYIAYFYFVILFSTLLGSLIYLSKKINTLTLKAGFLFLLLILLISCSTADFFYFIPILLAVLYWYTNKNKDITANYTFFSMATILSTINLFIKTNTGITSLTTLFAAWLVISFENKKVNWKQLLLGVFYLVLISMLMVKLYFGNIQTIFNWLKVSLIIASGYTEAMVKFAKWPNPLLLLSALTIIGLFLYTFIENIKNKSKNANMGIIFLPYLFFQFKSGFVRQDLHMLNFYMTVLFILALLVIFDEIKTKKNKIILLVILFLTLPLPLAFNGFGLNQNLFASTIKTIKNGNHKIIDSSEENLPSNWVKLLGGKKVEILPFEFSYAPKYDLNIQFNPILQLYSVYTKELDEISANSYISPKNAPKYIIINNFKSVDKRNMFFDNPATWTSIKANYKPLYFKDDKILLEKRNKALNIEYKTFKSGNYKFNEQIIVPKGAKRAIINSDLTLMGKITLFMFRLTPMYIYITDENNQERKIKQIRDVLKNGLYLNPFITDIKGLNDWFKDEPSKHQIQSFRLQVRQKIFYKKELNIEWQK